MRSSGERQPPEIRHPGPPRRLRHQSIKPDQLTAGYKTTALPDNDIGEEAVKVINAIIVASAALLGAVNTPRRIRWTTKAQAGKSRGPRSGLPICRSTGSPLRYCGRRCPATSTRRNLSSCCRIGGGRAKPSHLLLRRERCSADADPRRGENLAQLRQS